MQFTLTAARQSTVSYDGFCYYTVINEEAPFWIPAWCNSQQSVPLWWWVLLTFFSFRWVNWKKWY